MAHDREVKPTLQPRTYEQCASVCKGHLIPALGRKRFRTLTPTDVRAYLQAKLETNLSPRSVANHLRRALEIAYRYGYVEENLARLVSAPRATRHAADSRARRCSCSWVRPGCGLARRSG